MDSSKLLPLTKSYLNIDFDDDDELIQSLIDGAMEYMENAGVPPKAKEKNLYKLAVYAFVHYYYYDRENISKKRYSDFNIAKNDQTFRNMLEQLKYAKYD